MRNRSAVVETLSLASEILVCPTVMGELLAGFKNGSREKQNRQELETFLDNPSVREVVVDSETGEYYAAIYRSLRVKGAPIPTNDMWIAASALQHGLALCTLDAHFENIGALVRVNPIED